MFFKKFIKTATPAAVWEPVKAGYEKTDSPELIRISLDRLKNGRIFITLLCGEYQSGNSVLIDFSDSHVHLDKPPDWPRVENSTAVQVVFKDDQALWNYYNTKLIAETDDTLIVTFPLSLMRLQRRSNYRVKVPSGSFAAMMQKEKEYFEIKVIDVSLSGVLVCMHYTQNLKVGELKKIILTLRTSPDSKDSVRVALEAGSVVRRSFDEDSRNNCYGISFKADGKSKELLMKYIRRLEIDSIRKSLPK